jgi:hypothetical protein
MLAQGKEEAMATATDSDILPEIPDPDSIRRRLAVVLTEADLLRDQLRVSARLQRERERLRHQEADQGGEAGAQVTNEPERG